MATFVLVHGSWAGGWQWAPIRERLEARGHRVLAPSLTGMADRFHLADEGTGLATHIDDIARLIEWEDLDDVVLAGHSYGGMVITGVAARVPQRLRHLVYVDAFLPRPGECAWDLLPWQPAAFETLRLDDRPWLVRPVDVGAFFPELGDFDGRRLTPMPIRTHQDKLPGPAAPALPATYVHCRHEPAYFDEIAARAAADGMAIEALDAGHMVILTHADDVAHILAAAAAPR